MALTPGTLITPLLRLERPLGAGGMGAVWVATHLGQGTEVAVKFLLNATHLSSLERFAREATLAASIDSPHVVEIFDNAVTETGIPFIVMEMLNGEDLRQHVLRVGPLSLRDTAVILGDVAKALSKAHAMGIVHRDIKPDNIFLVDPAGARRVKVLDFGIAKSLAAEEMGITTTGGILGTPYYMSPEQMTSTKTVGPSADVWSFAVVIYFCLTGVPPFDAENLAGLAIKVNAGVFTPPSQVVAGLPPEVDALLAKALRIPPAERFGTIDEIMAALAAVANATSSVGRGTTSSRVSPASLPPSTPQHTQPLLASSSQPHVGTVGPGAPMPSSAPSYLARSASPSMASTPAPPVSSTPSVSGVSPAAIGTLSASARSTIPQQAPRRNPWLPVLIAVAFGGAFAAGLALFPSVRRSIGVERQAEPSSPVSAAVPASEARNVESVAPDAITEPPAPTSSSGAVAEPSETALRGPRSNPSSRPTNGNGHPDHGVASSPRTPPSASTVPTSKPPVPPSDGRLGF